MSAHTYGECKQGGSDRAISDECRRQGSQVASVNLADVISPQIYWGLLCLVLPEDVVPLDMCPNAYNLIRVILCIPHAGNTIKVKDKDQCRCFFAYRCYRLYLYDVVH